MTAHDAMAQLRAAREAQGRTLADVAADAGMDKGRLSRLENDPDANPTFATVARVAEALGVRLKMTVES